LVDENEIKSMGWFVLGQISCLFLPPGGSMVPRYVVRFLLNEKAQILKLNLQPPKLYNKYAHIWNP
jgi:hypothetical protein